MIAFSSVGLFSDIVLQQANFNFEDVDSWGQLFLSVNNLPKMVATPAWYISGFSIHRLLHHCITFCLFNATQY